jgi:hypothetical protein
MFQHLTSMKVTRISDTEARNADLLEKLPFGEDDCDSRGKQSLVEKCEIFLLTSRIKHNRSEMVAVLGPNEALP